MIVCIICFVFNDGYRQSKYSHVLINFLTYSWLTKHFDYNLKMKNYL